MEDWLTYIRIQCAEHPETAEAVRKKEKSLKGCIAALLKWSFGNQHPVDGERFLKEQKRRNCQPLHTRNSRNGDGTQDHHRILSGKVGGQHEKKSD